MGTARVWGGGATGMCGRERGESTGWDVRKEEGHLQQFKSGLLCSDPSWRRNSEALTHVEHVSVATQSRAGGWYLLLAHFRPSEVL